ncbi:MAG: hypothetical protein Q9P01_07650 [Anaerolineae bacterium]|nr:hypothetical protein [Anaerolineae bacterium]MDQ7034699.1 hypothetical protein [Anaerolineae bacterium]
MAKTTFLMIAFCLIVIMKHLDNCVNRANINALFVIRFAIELETEHGLPKQTALMGQISGGTDICYSAL